MSSESMLFSKDFDLRKILENINECEIQLPDFQRGWIWDNDRIMGLIASLSLGYPMGAIMILAVEKGRNSFSSRVFKGVENKTVDPKELVLDGQQRLTSMYCALFSQKPVETYKGQDKQKKIQCYYYIDMNKALDSSVDRSEAIFAVPVEKQIRTNIGRDIELDISSPELEYKNEMFPLNIVFDRKKRNKWANAYKAFYNYEDSYVNKYDDFYGKILDTVIDYKLPVIYLSAETPKEGVCKVFENVNTGGVSLTVFELVTAMFAASDFNLREDWEICRNKINGRSTGSYITNLFDSIDSTAFLTAVTLYVKYKERQTLSCKRKDILELQCQDYKKYRNDIVEGFEMARKFILEQCIFKAEDLPYTTQIIPLSVICAILGKNEIAKQDVDKKLKKWFWCGVFGELYSSSNETRYANDVEDVVKYVHNEQSDNHTINQAFFSATRLQSLCTRNSAAYKGIMAMLYKSGCKDFIKGITMNAQIAVDESPDIHHIFPRNYCEKEGLPKDKWNSIINKTPIIASTNRSIGGKAPSEYIKKIIDTGKMIDELKDNIVSHKVNYDLLVANDFDNYYVDRARNLLDMIELAMDKEISDRKSQETKNVYGAEL